MSANVIIYQYPTYIAIDTDIYYGIPGTNCNLKIFVDSKLLQYEYYYKLKKWLPAWYYAFRYSADGQFRLPRYALNALLKFLLGYDIVPTIKVMLPDPAYKVYLPRKQGWRDRKDQTPCIQFMMKQDIHMRALASQTGSGKTYMGIKTICQLGYKTAIIVSGLLDQWERNFYEQTRLTSDDIYVVQGHKSIGKLYEMYEIPYKVFLMSTDTLNNYVTAGGGENYQEYPPADEFFKYLGIGTKLIDECHLNFRTNVLIDLMCRVMNNLYLSATYMRSNSSEKRIFNMIYPNDIKFGEGKYKRYVNIYCYKYCTGTVPKFVVSTPQGYNAPKYEQYLMRKSHRWDSFCQNIVTTIIYSHYLNTKRKGQKMAILFSKITTGKRMMKFLKRVVKEFGEDLKVGTYFYNNTEKERDALDIIISTPGSLGTGKDVKGLITVFCGISFQSESQNRQVLGRLREPKGRFKKDIPHFITICDTGVVAQVRHYETRKRLFSQLGKRYTEITLST